MPEPSLQWAARSVDEHAEDGDVDRDAVLRQLNRLLANPLFTNSRRYPGLLKYIVEESVAGRVSQLKERTLGIAVFGRDPDYDTSTRWSVPPP